MILGSYEQKINILHKIKFKSNSVLFTEALSLKNKTLDKIVKKFNRDLNRP